MTVARPRDGRTAARQPRRGVMTTSRRRPNRTTRRPRSAARTPAGPPPVRLTRIRTVLSRIASGYYDRDDVRDRLAAAVLKELRRP